MILKVVEERCDWWVLAKGVCECWSVERGRDLCEDLWLWSVQCVVIALVSCKRS